MRSFVSSAFAITALVSAVLVNAHHSASAVFDVSKQITVEGTLTEVEWINPHIFITVEDTSDGEARIWSIEGAPPTWWRNVGINRAAFAASVGQTVVVEGPPARDGSNAMLLRKITLADGEILESVSPK